MENKKLLALAVAATIAATGAKSAIAQQSSESDTPPALEEVIVTALRKEQNIQDVPMSVNAISPDAVFDNAIFRFEDIGQLAPGLFLSNPGGGFGSIAQLRGVGFDSQASASPAVDIYINDTPVDANYAFQSIYDIGQIEVLRGPQGTLRGRPSPAGAITLTTARPELDGLRGAITGTASDQDARNVDGMVNVPIIADELALRVAGLHNENDGGQVESVGPGGNENTKNQSWRASLRWAPTDTIDATLTHQWLKGEQDTLTEVEGLGVGYNGPQIGDREGLAVQEMPNEGVLHFQLTTLQASWEVAENHRLIYTAAHQDNDFELSRDLDIYNGVAGYVQQSDVKSTYKVDTQELRLESTTPDNFMDYLVGLWYLNDNTESTFAQPAPQSGAFGDPGSPSPVGAPDPAYIVNADGTIPTHAENIAIYSNTVMHVLENTDLSLGVRYLQNKSDRGETINTSAAILDVPISPGATFDCASLVAFAPFTGNQRFPGYCELALPAGSSSKSSSDTETAWVYSASLQHNFTDDLMAYFSYGHSWRPAGVTVGITAPVSDDLIEGDPEESDSYELGVKSEWYEGRVRANAAMFYQSFDNFIGRFEEVPYLGPGPSVQSGGFTYPGDATVQGFETDVTADVTDNWWVQVSTAYADGTYDDATVPCRDTDKDGNPDIGDIGNIGTGDFGDNSVFYCTVDTAISATPKWVGNVQSEYTFPLLSGEGYVRGLFNYYAEQQDTGGFQPDPYSVLNLYVGMRGPNNEWDIGLWTKNVFDEDNQMVQGENQTVFGTFPSGYHQVGYIPEREIGLTVRYLFGEG